MAAPREELGETANVLLFQLSRLGVGQELESAADSRLRRWECFQGGHRKLAGARSSRSTLSKPTQKVRAGPYPWRREEIAIRARLLNSALYARHN